jgi:hypothetical protein
MNFKATGPWLYFNEKNTKQNTNPIENKKILEEKKMPIVGLEPTTP